MVFQTIDLTTALRPELQQDETLLFVQDGIGLYEGRFKIPQHQNGHVYLTSHRICYVDNAEPRKQSTAVALKNIDKYDYYAGFLKSSPKITLFPKSKSKGSRAPGSNLQRDSPGRSATSSPAQGGGYKPPYTDVERPKTVTWICPICTFSNILPSNFDISTANEHTNVPPCQTCGIKPPLAHLLKAAIASKSNRSIQNDQQNVPGKSANGPSQPEASSFVCPRCTFANFPSLLSCEMCGTSLVSGTDMRTTALEPTDRSESPGPSLESNRPLVEDTPSSVKISFRSGGDKIFYERLKGAMIQRKWLLENAPPIPPQQFDGDSHPGSGTATPERRGVGIAGLERIGLERRRNNETVLSSAFEDLEALMASAKEVIALAESFSDGKAGEAADGLGMTMTKDMLGAAPGADSLYLSELSRTLAEYLTDDRQGVLKREGGVISLVDLWAMYNRARNGVELVSPSDFEKAARMWEKFSLPVRLREFRSGLLVVQRQDWSDDKTIAQILAWLQELHFESLQEVPTWDQEVFGKGVTAQETAQKFGWSVGVATEELEMAEEKGVLCREESIEGLRFWENWLVDNSFDD